MVSKSELAYFSAFLLFSITNLIYTTKITNLFAIIPVASINTVMLPLEVILLLYVLIQKNSFHKILIAIAGFMLVLYFVWPSHDRSFIVSCLFVISAKQVDLSKLSKVMFWIELLLVIGIAFSAAVGLIGFVSEVRDGSQRLAFGFSSYNTFSLVILKLCFWGVLAHAEKLSYKMITAVTAVMILTYFLTDSRMTFFIGLLFILGMILIKKWPKVMESRILLDLSVLLLPVLTYLSVYVAEQYPIRHEEMQTLNDLFSGRLYFMSEYLSQYGIHLFGQKLNLVSMNLATSASSWSGIDNTYVASLISYGLITTIIVLILYSILLHHSWVSNRRLVFLIAVLMLFVGLTENGTFNVSSNFVLLYLFNRSIVTVTSKEKRRRILKIRVS